MTNFEEMYNGSWYTIVGAGGDLDDWKEGYQKMLRESGIGEVARWESFTGEEMNNYYGLKGTVAYPSDLAFLAFPLDGLSLYGLSIFKLAMQDRWFDDIVDNNARHMGREEDK